jgi:hypothetical protein
MKRLIESLDWRVLQDINILLSMLLIGMILSYIIMLPEEKGEETAQAAAAPEGVTLSAQTDWMYEYKKSQEEAAEKRQAQERIFQRERYRQLGLPDPFSHYT